VLKNDVLIQIFASIGVAGLKKSSMLWVIFKDVAMDVFRQLWFLKSFGADPIKLEISQAGLVLQDKKGLDRLIHWDEFSSAPVLRKGLLFSSIGLEVNNQKERISWLSKVSGRKLHTLLVTYLAELHGRKAEASLSQIRSLVTRSGYLRTSHATAIARFADSQRERLILPPDDVELPEHQSQPFGLLQRWADSDPALIEQNRADFVAEELDRFKDLFDSVESNPLTAKQREACVVDEDNNLVLAGAGTGKTSTMIGRAAYLLKSGRAQDSDILMLAFGRKAADEMQERIAEKIPGATVMAATFHSLGLAIIG